MQQSVALRQKETGRVAGSVIGGLCLHSMLLILEQDVSRERAMVAN